MAGIYISTILLTGILGVLLYITNSKVSKNELFSFIVTLCVMIGIQDYIAARAQLVTFILFVLEILFIECFIDTKKKRYALRLSANCTFNCKSSRGRILFFLYINDAIYRRVSTYCT